MKRFLFVLLLFLPLLLLLASPVWGTITQDTSTESKASVNGDTEDFSWSHTAGASPEGVVVFVVVETTTADDVIGVTYNSVSMTEITGSPLIKSSGETAAVHAFFLGASIVGGTKTVAVDLDGTSPETFAFAITFDAAADLEINTISDVTCTNPATPDYDLCADAVQSPSETLALGSVTSAVIMGWFFGDGSSAGSTPFGSWEDLQQEADFGPNTCGMYAYETIASDDVGIGWSTGSNTDDAVAIAVSINEVAGGAVVPSHRRAVMN